MDLTFIKAEAGGNDFVLVDARCGLSTFVAPERLARDLCRRRRSVGADGLVLVRGDPLEVVHLEPDGARTFCLNAVRAVAAWARAEGLLGREGTLVTDAGPLAVRVGEGAAAVALPPPRVLEPRTAQADGAPAFAGTFVDVGNPQFVVAVSSEDLEHPSLMAWGRGLRHLTRVFPEGTNVCFAARRADGAIALRTYERGVEDETLSCGTGAVATACALAGPDEPAVRLRTRGGDEQVVTFVRAGGRLAHVWADGPVRLVARGVAGVRCERVAA